MGVVASPRPATSRVDSRRLLTWRLLLGYVGLGLVFVGVWAALAPRSFYDHFPGFGQLWISIDGPYNEHLVRDVGQLNLALAVVTALALVSGRARAVRDVAIGLAVVGIPHLGYHLAHLEPLSTLDRVLEVTTLLLPALLALWVSVDASRWMRAHRGTD